MTLFNPWPQDIAEAKAYWTERELKKFAIDVTAGHPKKPTYAHTHYCQARTAERALAVVKRDAHGLPPRARYVTRLACPRELGCTRVTPKQQEKTNKDAS